MGRLMRLVHVAPHQFLVRLLVAMTLVLPYLPDGRAQNYPAKVVRYLVPTPAGSGADIIGRVIAGGLTQTFGQQVIVDNRAGAGNNIGAELAAKAPADGYTLFQASLTHAVNVTLYRNLSYDLVRDFAALTQLATSPHVVVVHPSLPVKTIGDLVKLARARPGVINYSATGAGTAIFFATELFKEQAGINIVHVAYRGGGEAMTAVVSGETSVQFAPLAIALPFIKERRVRALAVTAASRLPAIPDYPTVAEAGYPGYAFGNWFGLLVPVRTPKETQTTIRSAVLTTLHSPEANKRLRDMGYIPIGDQPDEFAAHMKSEIEKLGTVVRNNGLKPE